MKVLLCDPVDSAVFEHFANDDDFSVEKVFERPELEEVIQNANFLVVRSGTTVDEELIDQADQLIGVIRAGVGLDNINLDYAEDNGIAVQNTPEASSNAVAELVVGHILSLYRSISRADRSLKEGDWIKSELTGREIQGKTIGIIGYGRIGKRIGDLLEAFGASIIAHDEYIDDDEIMKHGAEPTSLDSLLTNSDIITIHVPLTDETKHLISTDELDKVSDNTILINCSRGGVYEEEALQKALDDEKILGVGLDTYETEPPGDSELIQHENMVGTPHIGASTEEAQVRIGQLVIDKIENLAQDS